MKRSIWVFADKVTARMAVLCDSCSVVARTRCFEEGFTYREKPYNGDARCENCKTKPAALNPKEAS